MNLQELKKERERWAKEVGDPKSAMSMVHVRRLDKHIKRLEKIHTSLKAEEMAVDATIHKTLREY